MRAEWLYPMRLIECLAVLLSHIIPTCSLHLSLPKAWIPKKMASISKLLMFRCWIGPISSRYHSSKSSPPPYPTTEQSKSISGHELFSNFSITYIVAIALHSPIANCNICLSYARGPISRKSARHYQSTISGQLPNAIVCSTSLIWKNNYRKKTASFTRMLCSQINKRFPLPEICFGVFDDLISLSNDAARRRCDKKLIFLFPLSHASRSNLWKPQIHRTLGPVLGVHQSPTNSCEVLAFSK